MENEIDKHFELKISVVYIDNAAENCVKTGRQWLVTMTSSTKAKGSIFVQFFGQNNQSSGPVMFHKYLHWKN